MKAILDIILLCAKVVCYLKKKSDNFLAELTHDFILYKPQINFNNFPLILAFDNIPIILIFQMTFLKSTIQQYNLHFIFLVETVHVDSPEKGKFSWNEIIE